MSGRGNNSKIEKLPVLNEDLHGLCAFPNIIRANKLREKDIEATAVKINMKCKNFGQKTGRKRPTKT